MGFDDKEQLPALLLIIALGATIKALLFRLGAYLKDRAEKTAAAKAN